jgi:hypothetical protein
MSVSRVLCLLLVAQVLLVALAYVSLLLIPLLSCGPTSMQSRCLFSAKGDSLDVMWPSGPHLTFGLLWLLALIGLFNAKKKNCVCGTISLHSANLIRRCWIHSSLTLVIIWNSRREMLIVTGICCTSDCVNETEDVLCSDKESIFVNALMRPIKPPLRKMKRFMRCSMESAAGRGIGPIKMASFADLKRLVNVPRFAIFLLCCVKVCSTWLGKSRFGVNCCYLTQSFVDIVGGTAVNLTGITGYCVAKPILVVHELVLRPCHYRLRCSYFALKSLSIRGWIEFQIELR